MELIRVDTQRAYERIRQMITTLELAPGITIDEGRLAEDLDMGLVPIREALKLLIHDNLVEVSSRGGIFVSGVSIPELEQISELRRLLESYCAWQAAQRATPDDILILEALRQEQATIPPEDSQRWWPSASQASSSSFGRDLLPPDGISGGWSPRNVPGPKA